MNTGRSIITLSLIGALATLGAACSGTSESMSEQEPAKTEEALSPTTSAVAFRNTSAILWESGPNYTGPTNGKIMQGTSPSISQMDGGFYRDVFQGQDGYLWLNGPEGPHNQWYGLDSKSSPSITGMPGGDYVYAFQANNHFLWVVGNTGILQRDWYGMMPGTSPSITVLPRRTWVAAFQAKPVFCGLPDLG